MSPCLVFQPGSWIGVIYGKLPVGENVAAEYQNILRIDALVEWEFCENFAHRSHCRRGQFAELNFDVKSGRALPASLGRRRSTHRLPKAQVSDLASPQGLTLARPPICGGDQQEVSIFSWPFPSEKLE